MAARTAPAPGGDVAPRSGRPVEDARTTPSASNLGAAARRSLDSIAATFDPAKVDESRAATAAGQAVPAIRALLPRLTSSDDSTWAEVHLAEALALTNDTAQACRAIRMAQSLARTPPQRQAVLRYNQVLGCGG